MTAEEPLNCFLMADFIFMQIFLGMGMNKMHDCEENDTDRASSFQSTE